MAKGDPHVHSFYSSGDILKYDCPHSPEVMVRTGSKRGLEWIGFTEHNTLKGKERWIEAGKKHEITIIPGIELTFKTGRKFWFWEEQYHVIILGIEEEPPEKMRKDAGEACEWAKMEYDAFVIAPHVYSPAGMKGRARERYVDAVEIHNPHVSPLANFRAKLLCEETNKIPITGSDSHSPQELGGVELDVHSSKSADDILRSLKKGRFDIIKTRYNSFFQPYRTLRKKYEVNFDFVRNYLKDRRHWERAFGLELLRSGRDDRLRARAFYTMAYLAWQTWDTFYNFIGLVENLLL